MNTQDNRLEPDPLLTTAEVAALFQVAAKTVSGWGKSGSLPSIRTPGGHRRYRQSVIRAILNGSQP